MLWLSLFLVGWLCATTASAQVPADTERRSTIVEAEGYSFLSDDKTLRDIREGAFADARRRALDAAAQWVQSYSRVKNFELEVNLVESAMQGQVRVIESNDLGIQQDNRYKVWIKAEVAYRLTPPARLQQAVTAQSRDADMAPDGPLTVRVWSDTKDYAEGEKLKIYLRGNKDFFARILLQDVSGNTIQLLPNRYREQNRFSAGVTYAVPSGADAFNLTISEPFGNESIVVFASTAPMPEITGEKTRSGLLVASDSRQKIADSMRGLALSEKTPSAGGDKDATTGEFVEAEWHIRTGRRKP